MAISDYSTDPDQNVKISGINIAEGCAPSGINNAIRQLMADVKAESDTKANASTFGKVKLSDSTSSSSAASAGVAATPKAVKAAYDRATTAINSAAAKVATVNGLAPDSAGNVDVGGMPLGAAFPYTGSDVPAGTLRADGATYTNMAASFPAFYAWVKASGLAVPMASYALVEGSCGRYGLDESTGSVRMPTLAAGVFGASAASEYGQAVEAGLPNITGTLGVSNGSAGVSGAFAKTTTADWNLAGGSNNVTVKGSFDASRSSAVYGKSDTVTPSHVKYPWVIVVYNAAVPASVAEAGEFVGMLDGKEDKGAVRDVNGALPDTYGHVNVPTGIPDARTVDINWGSEFYAPADGFVIMFGTTDTAEVCRLRIIVNNAGIDVSNNTFGFVSGNPIGIMAPIGKGMECNFEAYRVNVRRCIFIYAKGAY